MTMSQAPGSVLPLHTPKPLLVCALAAVFVAFAAPRQIVLSMTVHDITVSFDSKFGGLALLIRSSDHARLPRLKF